MTAAQVSRNCSMTLHLSYMAQTLTIINKFSEIQYNTVNNFVQRGKCSNLFQVSNLQP